MGWKVLDPPKPKRRPGGTGEEVAEEPTLPLRIMQRHSQTVTEIEAIRQDSRAEALH